MEVQGEVMADASVGCGCVSVLGVGGGAESVGFVGAQAWWGGLSGVFSPWTEETVAGVMSVWYALL